MANEEMLDMREPEYTPKTIYEIKFKDMHDKDVSMSDYKDKVILIVNVATMSPFSSQTYHELNDLYDKYHDDGLEILAFPCNQFGGQEPQRNEYVHLTALERFRAKFPVFQKIDVNGPSTAPLYKFLKDKKNDGERIIWNFTKFLVNRTGDVAQRYPPQTLPYKLEEDIQSLLLVELLP